MQLLHERIIIEFAQQKHRSQGLSSQRNALGCHLNCLGLCQYKRPQQKFSIMKSKVSRDDILC